MTAGYRQRSSWLPAEQRPPRQRSGPSERQLVPPGEAGRVASAVTMPAADVLALATAIMAAGRPGPVSALYGFAVLAGLAVTGQHRLRICLRAADQAGRFLAAAAVPLLLLLLLMAALPAAAHGAAGMAIAAQAAWSVAAVVAFRVAACAALRSAHRRGLLTEATLLIGSGTFAAHLAELTRQHPEFGLRVAGYLDNGPPRPDLDLPSLGSPASLADVVAGLGISRVIVCNARCKDEDLVTLLRSARLRHADVCVVPRLYEVGAAVPLSCLDEIWGIPLIPLRRPGRNAALAAKRVFDVAGVAFLLLAALPALLTAAVAVLVRSGRPVLFRQARVTGTGRTAEVLKLRTLGSHGNPDTSWTAPAQQCTPLGRWLRSTHADELPQLLNVLRGQMSLVGPRPERPYFAERFGREILRYSERTRMPAGLTGWAQVHGLTGDTSIAERARFDNQYIEYWSPWLDVVILARTVSVAARGLRGGQR